MLWTPMSSPQMTRMFGFLPAWADPADGATRPVVMAESRALRESLSSPHVLLSVQAPSFEAWGLPSTAAAAVLGESSRPAAVR